MARAPRGTGIPKSSGQGLGRYSYQQAYKLKPNTPMPKTGGKRTAGGLGVHAVKDLLDDDFAMGSTDLFQNVWDSHKEKS